VHSGEVTTRDGELARHRGSRRDDDRVVARAQVAPREILADLHPRAKARALSLHLAEAIFEMALLHLEVRDAVAQEPADPVVPLVDRDGVTGASELLCCGEARGA
jgi:hypothetical protein